MYSSLVPRLQVLCFLHMQLLMTAFCMVMVFKSEYTNLSKMRVYTCQLAVHLHKKKLLRRLHALLLIVLIYFGTGNGNTGEDAPYAVFGSCLHFHL